MEDETVVPFDFEKDFPHIIKVIGVGGGGGNAVNHMYREGIHDVTFVVCNTDKQILLKSPVPIKLQLGKEGLGAGNIPEKGRAAAEESLNQRYADRRMQDGLHHSWDGRWNRNGSRSDCGQNREGNGYPYGRNRHYPLRL